MPAQDRTPGRPDLIRRLVAASVAISLASIVGLSIFVATAPAPADPIDVDAVMVHIGGEGERIEAALGLWDEHAGFLIIPTGNEWDVDERWCGRDDRIICRPIHPETTLGEARLLGELVEEYGWRRVATVTTDHHVRRAGILDRRCTDADIVAHSAENDLGPLTLAGKYLHEIGGLVVSVFQPCDP